MALGSSQPPVCETAVLMETQYANLSDQYGAKPASYYELSRPEMVRFVPAGSRRVLEIGCSSGAFGALLKQEIPDCKIWGVEANPAAAAVAATRLDRVITGTFSSRLPELEGSRFDAICFNDVLEHMANPENALVECRSLLAPNGVVVASLPNILFFYQIAKILLEQDWRYEESGIMDNTHLRFFTRKSIVRMFEECGFEVSRIEGLNSSFGFKYKLFNLLTLGFISDWKYIQFGLQAKLR